MRARHPAFVGQLRTHGDRPALLGPDGYTRTYAELAHDVDAFADRLGKVRRFVLIAGSNSIGSITAYLAALRGGHVVLLAPGDHPAAVDQLISAYDPDVVIGRPSAPNGSAPIDERRQGTAHDLHPDLSLLLSTSGSTGSPKLVRLSVDNVDSNTAAIVEALGTRPDDRAATTLPMHYTYGLSVIQSHLLAGASVLVTDQSVVEPCFWERFGAAGATTLAGVPYTFDLLDRVRFEEMHLPALRLVLQAGGRLEPERVRAYAELGRTRGWDFAVMYGQTEATARMAVLPPALAAQWPNSIGRPIPGGDVRIAPVSDAPDGVGELVYRGPNVMLGYADSPSDLALGRVVHELRTGDLGRELPDGLFEVTGRRSAFIKVAGHRIDLDHVERRIQASGGPAWLAGRDDMLVAAVEGDQDAPDVARLASELAAIPGHLVHVLPVAEVPRLPTGKPDRAAILSLAATELDATQANEAPTADVSDPVSAITALYTEATGRQAADGDSFVGLEGDSLSYVHASLGLEEIVGRPPADWPTMTIGQLAALATPRDRRPRWRRALAVRWVDASVLLRAVAILCIVAQHTGALQILGGAHVLMAVAGFNFARFQLTPASRPQRLRSQARAIARIAVPAVVWIGLMLVLVDDYQLQNLFLANAIVGPERFDSTWHFWFVEMLLYVLVAMALLVSIPAVDRFERRWPLALAASVLLTGLLFRFGILEHDLTNPRPVLWLFAIGWAAGKTTTNWQRLALAGIAILAVPGFYGDTQRELIIGGGVLILIAVRHVPMPRLVAPVAGVLASASLYIYLVHWQVWKSLPDAPRLPVFALCIAAGLVAWLVAGRLTAWAVRGREALLRRRSDGQAQVLPASAG